MNLYQGFVDSSIVAASLGVGPKDLISDLNTMGFLFENLAIIDLRVYADRHMGDVYHYRDSSNLECDAVVQLRRWCFCCSSFLLERLVDVKFRNDMNM